MRSALRSAYVGQSCRTTRPIPSRIPLSTASVTSRPGGLGPSRFCSFYVRYAAPRSTTHHARTTTPAPPPAHHAPHPHHHARGSTVPGLLLEEHGLGEHGLGEHGLGDHGLDVILLLVKVLPSSSSSHHVRLMLIESVSE